MLQTIQNQQTNKLEVIGKVDFELGPVALDRDLKPMRRVSFYLPVELSQDLEQPTQDTEELLILKITDDLKNWLKELRTSI